MKIKGKLFLALAMLTGMPRHVNACDIEGAKTIVATGGVFGALALSSVWYDIARFSPSISKDAMKDSCLMALGGFGYGVVVGVPLAGIARATTYAQKLSTQEVVKPVAIGLAGLFAVQAMAGEVGRLRYSCGSKKYQSSWRERIEQFNSKERGEQRLLWNPDSIVGSHYYAATFIYGSMLVGGGALLYTAYQRYQNS